MQRSEGDRWLIINLVLLFMAIVQAAALGYALGWPVAVDRVIVAAVGLLFVGMGNYLPRIRSNWFIGIRTPWTLDNERVWRATHRVGGRAFVAAGLVMTLSALLSPAARAWAVGAAAVVAGVGPLAYSYLAYRRDLAGRPV